MYCFSVNNFCECLVFGLPCLHRKEAITGSFSLHLPAVCFRRYCFSAHCFLTCKNHQFGAVLSFFNIVTVNKAKHLSCVTQSKPTYLPSGASTKAFVEVGTPKRKGNQKWRRAFYFLLLATAVRALYSTTLWHFFHDASRQMHGVVAKLY